MLVDELIQRGMPYPHGPMGGEGLIYACAIMEKAISR